MPRLSNVAKRLFAGALDSRATRVAGKMNRREEAASTDTSTADEYDRSIERGTTYLHFKLDRA